MTGKEKSEIGIIGLGVMGRNFVLNIAGHDFAVSGYDQDPAKVDQLSAEAKEKKVFCAKSLPDLIGSLSVPRTLMLLVPAGAAVDKVLEELVPNLSPGDLIIDGGNSYFKDTDLRTEKLSKKNIHFMGVGISGGEYGARFGPSLMPGGDAEVYERVRPIFEKVAARVVEAPCVVYLGTKSSGHYVKMVHNGIEYGLMELIAETYDLLKRGAGLSDDELHHVYETWNHEDVGGYLIEISAKIFQQTDEKGEGRLVDKILDEAGQKGTGMWACAEALDLGVPFFGIEAAVSMRYLSVLKEERSSLAKLLSGPKPAVTIAWKKFVDSLRSALYFAMMSVYAQGFALLAKASEKYGYGLACADIVRIWRGGCIIRSRMLEEIRSSFERCPGLQNIFLDAHLAEELSQREKNIREIVCFAHQAGLPFAGFSAALNYYDSGRSAWLPANLIQAQRDYFGAHRYERIDQKGIFHTDWTPGQQRA